MNRRIDELGRRESQMQCLEQHEVDAEDVTVTAVELCPPFTTHVYEQSSSSLSELQQQPPAAALWGSDSAPKRYDSASRDDALCRGKVDIKRTLKPKQNPRRGDLKSSNGLAIENFRYLSKLNRTSPDVGVVGEYELM